VSAKEIISIVVAVIVGLVWVLLELKRWGKAKRTRALEAEAGLEPNPTRCADHEERLRKVEAVCIEVGPKISAVELDITEVKADVKQLLSIHLKN